MENTKKFDNRCLDEYEAYFTSEREDDFTSEIQEMERNSIWMPGIPRSSLTVESVDAPMFVREAVDKYGLEEEIVADTVDDMRTGTHLLVKYNGQTWCLRDTGRGTLYTTAGIMGAACGNMVKDESYADLSRVLNLCLKHAKGQALMLIRYGKLSAVHSGASDGYAVMPISELLKALKEQMQFRFGDPVFRGGWNSHGRTYCSWALPDVQSELVDKYQQAVSGAVSRNHSLNWMPVITFASSDTASSSAIVQPKLIPAGGGYPFTIGKGVKVEHVTKGGGAKFGMDLYLEKIQDLYALFTDSAETLEKLGKIELANPVNVVVGIAKFLKIAKKYADPAREEVESFTVSTPRMSALDVYLSMSQIPKHAKDSGASNNKVLELEEAVAKILQMDFSEYDVGGVVAW